MEGIRLSPIRGAAGEIPEEGVAAGAPTRSRYVLLQTLVTVVLCYQLLFSRDALLTFGQKQFVILALLLLMAGLMVVPVRVVGAGWFAAASVLGDTALVTSIIYLSGNAASDLYLAYFVVILIAASTPTLHQMIALSIILCATYGVILYVGSGQGGDLSEGQLLRIPLLLVNALFYGVSVETVRRERQEKAELQRQAMTDALSGLYNRRFLMEALAGEYERAKRVQRALSVLLIDVDHFKQINDTLGHQAGDQVIRGLAVLLQQQRRRYDVVGRYGGDEFLWILPEVEVAGAFSLGERIRLAAEYTPFGGEDRLLQVTLSIGAATYSPAEDSEPDYVALLVHADRAMYEAKTTGRNRVITAGIAKATSPGGEG